MPGPLSASKALDGFPAGGFGDRYVSCVDHFGPASYTQVTTGTPPTGGDSISAAEFGLKALSMVWADGLSDNGQFNVLCSPGNSNRGEPTTWFLEWVTAATGAQVAGATNLSARSIRLFAIGR